MFSLVSGASGCFELCSSMSCDRRRAQAMPAGPPPTMTTSASITGRSMLGSGFRKTIIKTYRGKMGVTIVTLLIVKLSHINVDPTLKFAPSCYAKGRAHVPAPVVVVTELSAGNSFPLGAFRLLHLFNQRRNDVEQIAYYGNVGDLKDRRL